MKFDTTKILLIILILIMGYSNFFKKSEPIEPTPVTVTIPESYGTTGLQTLEPKVIVVQTPVSQGSNQQVDVDALWKSAYEQASQEIKDSLYNEAIRIRTYNDTIVDNDEIMIKGNARTRGTLLDFKVDYNIKERDFIYVPEVVTQYPKLSLGLGMEIGVPIMMGENLALKGNLSLMNRKGYEINFSYDTDQRVWLGYKKTFKFIK